MGDADMNAVPVDASDIQGLVCFGYAALTEAAFLMLKVRDAAAARSWLSSAPVTTAERIEQAADDSAAGCVYSRRFQALGVSR